MERTTEQVLAELEQAQKRLRQQSDQIRAMMEEEREIERRVKYLRAIYEERVGVRIDPKSSTT